MNAQKQKALDYNLISNIEVDGIDTRDYPDFCDAFIASMDYGGRPATDEELDLINEDQSFVYDQVIKKMY